MTLINNIKKSLNELENSKTSGYKTNEFKEVRKKSIHRQSPNFEIGSLAGRNN